MTTKNKKIKKKKEWIYILLLRKLKHSTKEILKIFSIVAIGFGLIILMVLIKYKPMYEVKISNNSLGYIENINEFEETIESELIELNGINASFVTLNEQPEYELKLVNRDKDTDEKEIYAMLNEKATVTYKYFAVTLENQAKAYVSTLDQATQVVEDIKKQYADDVRLNLQIVEEYTENNSDINVEAIEVAETTIGDGVEVIKEDNKYIKINGVKIESMPINPNTRIMISSRFGEVSSIRSSAHKGLDLACKSGTDIKTIAKGTVVFAQNSGDLGNLVKVDHGNGVQTWYAHCSKIYASVGDEVEPGDVIAAVGSTGNSTGPHLHLEVRINGKAINPQLYIYNK
ncbi:MAG: M23 family metallopeptidase [Clostridia bacterium]|nr:M23 family metallopeptidase [Clostridia bacterium]